MSPSRYASVGTATFTTPDGRQFPYLRRRLLPALGTLASQRRHLVTPGERHDTIAAAELGDAELSWLLADANPVMRPSELASPGRTIQIPLPAGIPASPNAQ
jgi:hypothetical protein